MPSRSYKYTPSPRTISGTAVFDAEAPQVIITLASIAAATCASDQSASQCAAAPGSFGRSAGANSGGGFASDTYAEFTAGLGGARSAAAESARRHGRALSAKRARARSASARGEKHRERADHHRF